MQDRSREGSVMHVSQRGLSDRVLDAVWVFFMLVIVLVALVWVSNRF